MFPDDWPAYELVRTEHLFIDTSYQRPETRLIRTIAENFRPYAFGALLASRRSENRLSVMDGQQRLGASRLLGIERVPSLVSVGLTVAEEARIFVHQNRDRLHVRPVQRFTGELIGQVPRAIAIKRILDTRGIELVESSGRNAPADALSAITALEDIYDRCGDEILGDALDVVVAAWPGMRGRFQGEIVKSIGYFISQERPRGEPVDLGRLIDTLSGRGIARPEVLMDRSSKLRQGKGLGGGSIGYTIEVIRLAYERQRPRRRTQVTD